MNNREHINILLQDTAGWNEWRRKHAQVRPNLTSAYLSNIFLKGINFSGSMLSNANLSHSFLDGANFSGSNLIFTNFNGASLKGAIFHRAGISNTIFTNLDLSKVVGLDTVSHLGPSEISMSTIYLSKGKIPEIFLRGCGLPDSLIEYLPSLLNDPLQFYSCFISYSSKNQLFTDRLYADLQNKGVRCWLASEDLKIGDKIRVGIDESIRFHDKLLLVLSKHSVASDWVEQEVETALDRERKGKRTVLFPIRLDDTVMKIDTGWPALIKNTRNIGDFRHWKDHDSYQKAFNRLLRDLKAEES